MKKGPGKISSGSVHVHNGISLAGKGQSAQGTKLHRGVNKSSLTNNVVPYTNTRTSFVAGHTSNSTKSRNGVGQLKIANSNGSN